MTIGSGMTGDAFVGDALLGGDPPVAAEMPVAQGDMVLITSPNDPDIVLDTKEGAGSFSTTVAAGSTASFGVGIIQVQSATANGVAGTTVNNASVAFATNSQPKGKAEVTSNRMLVVLASDFFVIYTSKPPYKAPDVLLAKRTGPQLPDRLASAPGGFWIGGDMIGGDSQKLEPAPLGGQMYAFTTSGATVTIRQTQSFALRAEAAGRATMTARMNQVHSVRCTSNGVAGARSVGGMVNGWYLGSTTRMEATSNGRAGARNPVNATQSWYLGSTTRMEIVSRGVARPRTLTNTFDSWYLGSSVRMEATSTGRARMVGYMGSRVYIDATSAGRATATAKGTQVFAIYSTSAGRGGGSIYLGSPFPVTSTARGVGGARDQFGTAGRWYLGSPHRITSTAAGKATAKIYLGSPFHVFSTAAGKGGGILYLASRVYLSGTSSGRAGGSAYLSGTFLMPNITMRGVANWTLGETFVFGYSNGVGLMANVRLSGTQRHTARANGVGSMRENSILLRLVSNGSSKGTEFDKPPFAFVVRAGCRAFQNVGYYHQNDPYINHVRFTSDNVGVFAYLSSRIGFANDHPTQSHRGTFGFRPGPSRMAGVSTFTFPYEMVAISNAGCRTYDGHVADAHFVEPNLSNWERHDRGQHSHRSGYTGPEGVRFRQISPNYMSARTFPERKVADSWYMSSRVYYALVSRGRSNTFFRRVDEMDVFGIAGGDWTLGVDNRQLLTQSNGKGGWPINYLPDTRSLFTKSNGRAGGSAYISGNVHFQKGVWKSHGVGHMEILFTALRTTMNGVGHMRPIPRNPEVFMQWGLGEWFYEYHFPYIAPLLIPKGSNGMSRVEIEERSTGVIHHHMDGVASANITKLEGLAKVLQSRVNAGSYDWTQLTRPDPVTGDPGRRTPGKVFNTAFIDYHPQGVEAAFPIQPVLIAMDGVGEMTANVGVFYILRWQRWDGAHSGGPGARPYTSNDKAYDDNGVLQSSLGSGRAGAVGRFWIRPEPRFTSRANARADVGFIMWPKGIFAHDLRARGIARMIKWDLGGGSPPLDRYGNMLRYFFIPLPTWGQLWPRKERQHGQPV